MTAAYAAWEIREPDFVAEVAQTDPLELRLSGSADMSTKVPLEALIQRLHGQLKAQGLGKVRVDLRQLEFMSAASFTALVGWLSLINELPPERRYRIQFQSNPLIRWQRRSLGALSCFATDVVAVET
ncbi:MAG TPA: hypothetical protein VNO30_48065 [Kofleriaceae bacterium]|nr:hypothetical protein [Kofleriaceae bacterium]